MITDFLLSAIFGGITALLSLVPSWTLPDAGSTWTSLLMDLGEVDRIFPVNAALAGLAALLALKIALTVWDFVVFIYHQFWGAS